MRFLIPLILFTQIAFGSAIIQDRSITAKKIDQGGSSDSMNCSLATSVAASALTITLNNKAAATPSTSSPCRSSFRNATAATGTYAIVDASAATTLVISSGSTLGCVSAAVCTLSVYELNNAGSIELGVINGVLDEGSLNSSTAEGGAGAADSANVFYSTTARSNVAVRLITRIKITEATAGTWASNSTEISLRPFMPTRTFAAAYSPNITSYSVTNSTSFTTVSNAGVSSGRVLHGLAITPTTTNELSLRITSLPVGVYQLVVNGNLFNGTNGFDCEARIFDGTSVVARITTSNQGGGAIGNSGLNGVIAYTTAQSNIEFKVQIRTTSTNNCVWGATNGGTNTSTIALTRMDQ